MKMMFWTCQRFVPALIFSVCVAFTPRTSRTWTRHDMGLLKLRGLKATQQHESVRVGFVGCGTIAAAIATGLAKQEKVGVASIAVSRRSQAKSEALQNAFPDLISVYDNNQDVVAKSELVFLCVLPQQTSEVLSELDFDPARHTLVSLVSTSTIEDLAQESGLDANHVYKMICLPSVANLEGVCLVVPEIASNNNLTSMFESLGGCVECKSQKIMNALMIPGGMMGPLYGILQNNVEWLIQHGVPPKDASFFVGRQYWGMMQDAVRNCEDPNRFQDLIEEQTPGGLNEQALHNLKVLGAFEAYNKSMDEILDRLEGRSDGWLRNEGS